VNAGAAAKRKYVDILSPRDKQHILYGDGPNSGGHLWEVVQRTGSGKTPFPPRIGHPKRSCMKWYVQTGNGGKYTKKRDPAKWIAYEMRSGERIKVVYQPAIGRVVTAYPDKSPMPNLKEVP